MLKYEVDSADRTPEEMLPTSKFQNTSRDEIWAGQILNIGETVIRN